MSDNYQDIILFLINDAILKHLIFFFTNTIVIKKKKNTYYASSFNVFLLTIQTNLRKENFGINVVSLWLRVVKKIYIEWRCRFVFFLVLLISFIY